MNGKISIEELDNNLKSKMKDLEKSENTKYSTVNGIKEFTCERDGYIDNIHIEGETVKNEVIFNNFDKNYYNIDKSTGSISEKTLDNRTWNVVDVIACLEPNTQYFIGNVILPDSSITISLYSNYEDIDGAPISYDFGNISNGAFTTNSTQIYLKAKITGSGVSQFRIFKSPKDHGYIEGIKSIGQGDKIEILNKNTSNNILKSIDISYTDDYLVKPNGDISNDTRYLFCYSNEYIPIDESKIYIGDYLNRNVCYYDINKIAIDYPMSTNYCLYEDGVALSVMVPPNGAKYLRFSVKKTFKNKVSIYENSKYDKKQILTTIRGLSNTVRDEIIKQGDKYYKIKRYDEIVLNGSENWDNVISQYNSDTVIGFVLRDVINTKYLISDKFTFRIQTEISSPKFEYITCEPGNVGNWFVIGILKSKLTSQDLSGFKTWLSSNPITVVYELPTPVIEELSNFNPHTFDNKNTILLNTGVLQGETSFEVTNSTRSGLEIMKTKLDSVENGLIDNIYGFQQYNLTSKNGRPIDIAANDINLYTKTGLYNCWGSNLNRPTNGGSFVLKVIEPMYGYSIQEVYYYNGLFPVYTRNLVLGKWTAWRSTPTSSTISLMEQQISELELQLLENGVI